MALAGTTESWLAGPRDERSAVEPNGDTDSDRAAAALLGGDGRYCRLYEQIPLMYFTLSAEGKVLMVNSYGAEHLGYRPAELIGQPVLEVFHPEDRSAVSESLRNALAEPGRTVTWRFRKVRKDGTPLWVRETVRVVEEAGRPTVSTTARSTPTPTRKTWTGTPRATCVIRTTTATVSTTARTTAR